MSFQNHLTDVISPFEAYMERWVHSHFCSDEFMAQSPLKPAMIHGALAGGKRFRPFLVIETGKLFGCKLQDCYPVALGLELIHAYSLIHDDLPSMDNDILRRGQPTVWHKYSPATAILAGDALQAACFERLVGDDVKISSAQKCALVQLVALAAGVNGMVGGQALDLEFEEIDESWDRAQQAILVAHIHGLKTGALIKASVLAGGIVGGADEVQTKALEIYGAKLGLAFQISDDLLDMTASEEELGKTPGKDKKSDKLTFVSVHGVEGARQHLFHAIKEGIEALQIFDKTADGLRAALTYMKERRS